MLVDVTVVSASVFSLNSGQRVEVVGVDLSLSLFRGSAWGEARRLARCWPIVTHVNSRLIVVVNLNLRRCVKVLDLACATMLHWRSLLIN